MVPSLRLLQAKHTICEPHNRLSTTLRHRAFQSEEVNQTPFLAREVTFQNRLCDP